MPSVSVVDVSLVVIAAAFVVAVAALVPVLIQLRRTAIRAETALQAVPGVLADLDVLIARLNKTTETVGSVAASVERLDGLAKSAVETAEGVLETFRVVARDVVVPSIASVAGLMSAVREGVTFGRVKRDTGRDGK